MKRVIYVILVLILTALVLKACLKADVPQENMTSSDIETSYVLDYYPYIKKNVTINGVDYLQSEAPVGKFGGTFVSSTIGEGPKHLIRSIPRTTYHPRCLILCMTDLLPLML